jgi:sodium-dependent dicarboxylate transporter 2/3/5
MFLGSMILAYAMEHVRLHRRLALLVLRFVGSSIIWYVLFFFLISNESFSVLNRSMAGLMGVTAFLSMWINNSAAANIMIPTAIAIVNELQNNHRTDVTNKNDNHKNTIDSASIDFTSKEQLYSNI